MPGKKEWTDMEVYELLCDIDGGYRPSEEERAVLSHRQRLDLFNTKITALPDSIWQLSNLQDLDLRGTNITALPDSIGQLSSLQRLDLNSTKIAALPDSIGQLSSLQSLDLYSTPITALPEFIGQLSSLQSLDLRNTQITKLPKSFKQLKKNLQHLFLSNTKITDLPEYMGQFSNLERLFLSGTEITKLRKSIGQLPSLRCLSLRFTGITTLPESFGQLKNLQRLDLSSTNITALPKELALGPLPIVDEPYGESPGIYAKWTRLPPEYFAGKEILRKYLEKDEKRRFREAKIIFLGDGNAGKTFTVTRIRKDGAPEPAEGPPYSPGQTHGVMPCDHTPPGTDLTLHLWDFGGQEMFHAMHRCFLTRNTVYVLMVSTRDSEHTRRLRYWLHGIRSFAKGSTVTVIVNIFDGQGRADVDEIGLKYEFKNELDLDFIKISAKDASKQAFQKEIMQPIIDRAEKADERFGSHPAVYMRIKDHIRQALRSAFEEKNRGYIGAEDYIRYCGAEGITDPKEQAALLRYFTALGVCFSTVRQEDEAVPADCRLIEPVWLTNALYAIIEECKPHQGWVGMDAIEACLGNAPRRGRSADYVRVEPKLRYEPDDCAYVLRVAEQFALAYRDPREPDFVFLPAMCNYTDRPAHIERPDDPPYRVVYEVEYPYLPETVVQRLMVECLLEGYKKQTTCWRGGFRLEGVGFAGIVDTAAEDRALRIDLWSSSNDLPVRRMLKWFREKLGLPDENRKEYIIHNGERFSVRRLLNSEHNALYEVTGDTGPRLQVRRLLGAFPVRPDREFAGTNITVHGPYIDQRDNRGQQTVNYTEINFSPVERETELSWDRFKANYSNTQVEFEHLCTELFRLVFFSRQTVFRSDPNNPGVEIHPEECLQGKYRGKRISFQSKFFGSSVKYKDIEDSADKTIKNYSGELAACYLYCNKNLTKASYEDTEMKLKAAGISLELVAGRELLDRIQEYPELVQRYFYK